MDECHFADFVRNRSAALHRYGFVLTGNHHDADDLVQDALIRLRAHWDRVARKDDPVGYVRTTMARLHVSMWRRHRREVPSPCLPEEATADAALDQVEQHDHAARIRAGLGELPPRQRAVVVLRYYEQLTDAEV